MNLITRAALIGGITLSIAGGAYAATNVHYLAVQKETEGWPKILSSLTKDYKATHPDTNWEYEYIPQTEINQRVQLLAASGTLPTLFNIPSPSALSDMYKNGMVLNVGAVFKEQGISNTLNPAIVGVLQKLEGKGSGVLYELPLEMNIEGIWYNKALFEKNGIAVPKTWAELSAAARKLKAAGVQPFAASGQQGWPITRLIGAYAARKLGPDALEKVRDGKLTLTDPGFVEAAQAIQDFATAGYFGDAANTLEYGPAQDLFLQGKAAMFYMGSWALRDFNDPKVNKVGAANIGIFNVPNVAGGKGSDADWSMNAGLTTAVSKAEYEKNPKGLNEWFKYTFARYGDRAMADLGLITGFTVNNQPADTPALTKLVLEKIAATKNGVLWFEAFFNPKATAKSYEGAQMLITGRMKAADYMKSLQDAQKR